MNEVFKNRWLRFVAIVAVLLAYCYGSCAAGAIRGCAQGFVRRPGYNQYIGWKDWHLTPISRR